MFQTMWNFKRSPFLEKVSSTNLWICVAYEVKKGLGFGPRLFEGDVRCKKCTEMSLIKRDYLFQTDILFVFMNIFATLEIIIYAKYLFLKMGNACTKNSRNTRYISNICIWIE